MSTPRILGLSALSCSVAAWGLYLLSGAQPDLDRIEPLDLADRIIAAQGCYQIRLEPSLGPPFIGFTPSLFRLSADPNPHPYPGMQVEPHNPGLTYMAGPPNWGLTGEDSLVIEWGSGLGGVQLRLQQRGEALIGKAEGSTDVVGGPQPSARAEAVRVECPTSPIAWQDAP